MWSHHDVFQGFEETNCKLFNCAIAHLENYSNGNYNNLFNHFYTELSDCPNPATFYGF